MSAIEALAAASAAGVRIRIDGGDLVLKAASPPPTAVLSLLSRHKANIVTLLSQAEPHDSAEAADWRDWFEERAAMRQFEAGYQRNLACGL